MSTLKSAGFGTPIDPAFPGRYGPSGTGRVLCRVEPRRYCLRKTNCPAWWPATWPLASLSAHPRQSCPSRTNSPLPDATQGVGIRLTDAKRSLVIGRLQKLAAAGIGDLNRYCRACGGWPRYETRRDRPAHHHRDPLSRAGTSSCRPARGETPAQPAYGAQGPVRPGKEPTTAMSSRAGGWRAWGGGWHRFVHRDGRESASGL